MNAKDFNKTTRVKKFLSLKPEITILGPEWDSQTELFNEEKDIPYDIILNCSFEKWDNPKQFKGLQ